MCVCELYSELTGGRISLLTCGCEKEKIYVSRHGHERVTVSREGEDRQVYNRILKWSIQVAAREKEEEEEEEEEGERCREMERGQVIDYLVYVSGEKDEKRELVHSLDHMAQQMYLCCVDLCYFAGGGADKASK